MHNVILEFENPNKPDYLKKADFIHGFNFYSFLFLEVYALYKKRRLAFVLIPALQWVLATLFFMFLEIVIPVQHNLLLISLLTLFIFIVVRVLTSMLSESLYIDRLKKQGYKLVSFRLKNKTKDTDITLEELKECYDLD